MKKIITIFCFFALAFVQTVFAQQPIKFATEATYPPFESVDASGTIQGFDVDIMHALCQQMQRKCIITNQPWESLIPSLKIGKFDALIGAMSITPAREKVVAFTQPYYENTGSIIAAKSAKLVLTKQDLSGKTIGIQGGTTFANYLQATYGSAVSVKNYASIQDALIDLQSGRIDAVMGDTPIILSWLRHHQNNYAVVGQPISSKQYFGVGYGIAVQQNNQQLLAQLNQAIKAIKADGTYAKIVNKYFGLDS